VDNTHIVASEDNLNKAFCNLFTNLLSKMSVFSLDTSHGNPVTKDTVDQLCSKLGVSIEEKDKEDYRRLLAVFHDASAQLMAMDGM